MSDDALVTFGAPSGPVATFHDVGYMPISQLTLGGQSLQLPQGLDGAFIHYVGNGTQNFLTGVITYTDLHYELVGYKGTASFPASTGGDPAVSGALDQVVLAQGDLIKGVLQFGLSTGVHGQVDASVQVGGKTVGELDINVDHAPADIQILGANGPFPTALTLNGGSLQGTFKPLATG